MNLHQKHKFHQCLTPCLLLLNQIFSFQLCLLAFHTFLFLPNSLMGKLIIWHIWCKVWPHQSKNCKKMQKLELKLCLQMPLLFYNRTTLEILIVTIEEPLDPDFLQKLMYVGKLAIFKRESDLVFNKIAFPIRFIWNKSRKLVCVLTSPGCKAATSTGVTW